MRRLLLGLTLALLLPGSADAQTRVVLGQGAQVGVTVDGEGTGYMAWNGNEPVSPTSLTFCRLPRGAGDCAPRTPIAAPGTSLTRPFVVVDGQTVRVLSYRYGLQPGRFDAVYMFTSTDGGATFDAGVQIGTVAFYDAIRTPGGTVGLIENNASNFQRAPLAAGPVEAEASLSPSHPYTPSLAALGSGSLLAVFASGNSEAQFRRFAGVGDPNDANSWTPPATFATFAAYLRLATGPSGTFAMSDNAGGNLEVRRFAADETGFGAPVAIPGPAKPLTGGSNDMTQDPAGRLHAVWPFGDATGTHVGYATSDDGATWAQSQFDAGDPASLEETVNNMRLAVASDHQGFAVWDGGGRDPRAYAIAIGPSAVGEPVVGRTANVEPVSGKVFVKLPAGARAAKYGLTPAQAAGFVPLSDLAQVPLGSTLDTKRGRVEVETAVGLSQPGQTQSGQFYDGVFSLRQVGSRRAPVTELGLSERLTCTSARSKVTAAARSRRLWGNARGRFRTRGRHSTATVRGTRWLTKDSCRATTTTVRSGTVVVRDLVKRRNVTVRRAGAIRPAGADRPAVRGPAQTSFSIGTSTRLPHSVHEPS